MKEFEEHITDTNKIIKTYNAAADSFDKEPLGFWNFFGNQTIDLIALKQGDSVLDICCGSGASALPAAKQVGGKGLVIGIDISDKLLHLGQAKADKAGLDRVFFIEANMEDISFPHQKFDAVICVFGIFFFEDMEEQLKRLWKWVKPNGKLAITTWGSDLFAPASQIWNTELSKIRKDLVSDFSPWDEITTEKGLINLFSKAGIQNVRTEMSTRIQNLGGPEDFWTIAMGSGFRWAIEQLTPKERTAFKSALICGIKSQQITSIETNALIAVATKFPTSDNSW